MRARRIAVVPRPVVALVLAGALAQVGWHGLRPPPVASAVRLPEAPGIAPLRLAALGEPAVLARVLMLWLQSHDNQPGVSIPFRHLDYERVARWLGRILDLDPRTQYPLLAASRIYGAVSDERRTRVMLEFVHRRFLEDPNRRWRWLAHAAIVARHELGDRAAALRYARALTERATGPEVPAWARDMSVVLLQDMGEYEAALYLAHRLLESGRVTDPNEIRFLERRLEELRAARPGERPEGGN